MTKCLFEKASKKKNSEISRFKVAPTSNRGASNTKVASKRKKRPKRKISAKFEVTLGKVLIDLPLITVSEANCFEHWRVKHARHKAQQKAVMLSLKPIRTKITLPCKVMLTRFAPNELDTFDNLPMSFKFIVDAICAVITGNYTAGKADSDKRISIACGQVKSPEYGVRIEITF